MPTNSLTKFSNRKAVLTVNPRKKDGRACKLFIICMSILFLSRAHLEKMSNSQIVWYLHIISKLFRAQKGTKSPSQFLCINSVRRPIFLKQKVSLSGSHSSNNFRTSLRHGW
uniref:Uncharacterized protein n=1 Tax=Romanomermis culicivorax TaxID=13658 RepID=A0A915KPL4_ROMCU